MSVMATNHLWGLPVQGPPRWFGKPLHRPEARMVYHCYLKGDKRYICGTNLVADEALPGGTRLRIVRVEST